MRAISAKVIVSYGYAATSQDNFKYRHTLPWAFTLATTLSEIFTKGDYLMSPEFVYHRTEDNQGPSGQLVLSQAAHIRFEIRVDQHEGMAARSEVEHRVAVAIIEFVKKTGHVNCGLPESFACDLRIVYEDADFARFRYPIPED